MSDVNYTKRNWENSPSTNTPISAENLGAMDQGIMDCALAINSNNTDITNLKTNLKANNKEFVFDYDGTDYGYKIGNTFHPFKKPTGTKSITANGTYDVTDYASANVNVPVYYTSVSSTTTGTFSTTINCGFKPTKIIIAGRIYSGDNGTIIYVYNSGQQANQRSSDGTSSNAFSISLTSTGFTMSISQGWGWSPCIYYIMAMA